MTVTYPYGGKAVMRQPHAVRKGVCVLAGELNAAFSGREQQEGEERDQSHVAQEEDEEDSAAAPEAALVDPALACWV